jgi:hypothetical protein
MFDDLEVRAHSAARCAEERYPDAVGKLIADVLRNYARRTRPWPSDDLFERLVDELLADARRSPAARFTACRASRPATRGARAAADRRPFGVSTIIYAE